MVPPAGLEPARETFLCVAQVGFEPTIPLGRYALNVVCIPVPPLSQSHVSPQVEGLLSESIRRRGTDHTLPLRGVHDAINAVLGGPTRRTVIYLLAATCFKHASNAKAVCLAPPGGSPLHFPCGLGLSPKGSSLLACPVALGGPIFLSLF